MISPRGHAEPRELVVYHAGQMAEDEAERLRDHLALCPECSELLLDLIHFDELEMPEGVAEPSEAEVAAALANLKGKLRSEAPPVRSEPQAQVLPFRDHSAGSEKTYRPATWQIILPWAVAASLAAVSLTLWLRPLEPFIVDGSAQTRSASVKQQGSLVSFDRRHLPLDAEPPFRLIIRAEANQKVLWASENIFFEGADVVCVIPPGSLRSGHYIAYLFASSEDGETELTQKSFYINGR